MKNPLAIDIGGSRVKLRIPGVPEKRHFESGPTLTPGQMVEGVKRLTGDWDFDSVSIGLPAPIRNNHPARQPANLGPGWVEFDYDDDFGLPVKLINDAAMQALGSYEGGKLLFMGFGTGLGTAMVYEHLILPLEGGHLPFRNGTFESHVGNANLTLLGKKQWKELVLETIERFQNCFQPDEIVLGGGNSKHLEELPPNCRLGSNKNAFAGGFKLWEGNYRF
jgi:predicted NBD/HSP70 family sugar kinase